MSYRPLAAGRVLRAGAAMLAIGALALTGCASNDEAGVPTASENAAPVVADDSLRALLPQEIADAGVLRVGVELPYSPNEFKDADGKIVGFDVDLLNAVAGKLGLENQFNEADFARIVPAVEAGTYDVGMSSITDTKEREKQVDFVNYVVAGLQWATTPGTEVDPENACGLTVSVQANTVSDEELEARTATCAEEGKEPINILKYEKQDEAANAVVVGKATAMSADSPVTAWAVKQSNGKLVAVGELFDSAPYGWAVQKGSKLGDALAAAFDSIVADGTYKSICDTWGVTEGLLEKAGRNASVS